MKTIMLCLIVLLAMVAGALGECTDCDGEDAGSEPLDITYCVVEVDGREVEPDRTVSKVFERGDTIEIEVEFVSQTTVDDVQIQALILGYEHGHRDTSLISDFTSTFTVKEGRSYKKDLELTLPDDLDQGDLKLRIIISDRFAATYVEDFNLDIEAVAHDVIIKDVVLDPSNKVVSGNVLVGKVRIKNMGDKDEEEVKVTMSIPAIGLKGAAVYIDELESDDSETSDEVFLMLPECMDPGVYVVRAEVEFDDGYETIAKEVPIQVVEADICTIDNEPVVKEDKTVVTVPGAQQVVIGTSGAIYPLVISNSGPSAKTYAVTVSGTDEWATTKVEPSVVTIKSGSTEAVYLYVTAAETAEEGEKVFVANVQSGSESKQIPLTAEIKASHETGPTGGVISGGITDWNKIRQGLEVGLVVLIVLLVILALVIGFNKLKGAEDDSEEETSGQTYY